MHRPRPVSSELIVRRPAVDEREVVSEVRLDVAEGVVGDSWRARGNSHTPDGSADPEAQLTLMNARAADAVAGDVSRWPLAGDQIYADFDIGIEHLPPGTRLVDRRRRDRGVGEAPHRLRQVLGSIRNGRAAVREQPRGPPAAPPRHEHQDHQERNRPRGRSDLASARRSGQRCQTSGSCAKCTRTGSNERRRSTELG